MSDRPAAVVTGGASGIGAAIVHRLHDDGYAVDVIDRDEPAHGLARRFFDIDLLDADAMPRVEDVLHDPSVTTVVNCAGIYPTTPARDITLDEWQRVLTLDLTVPFAVSQAAMRVWSARDAEGSIVQVSSTAAHTVRAGAAHYAAAKAGLTQLTRVLAVEWAAFGIRVNAVGPGLVVTEAGQRHLDSEPGLAAEHEQKISRIPMGRVGEAREIANVVGFLASPDASYMTGQTVYVDGGYTAGSPYRR